MRALTLTSVALAALALVACGGSGDAQRSPTAASPEALPSAVGSRTIHALTAPSGALAKALREQGWTIVPIGLDRLDDPAISMLYVDVNAPGAKDEALQDALAAEKRPLLFDSQEILESIVVVDDDGRIAHKPGDVADSHITALGAYLASLTGFGVNATAVLIHAGDELPIFVDGRGQLNGQPAAALLQSPAFVARFIDYVNEKQSNRASAAAQNGASGTLVLTDLADKPRTTRASILSARGNGESATASDWDGPVSVDGSGRIFEKVFDYHGIRIAMRHRIRVKYQYFNNDSRRSAVISVTQASATPSGGIYYAEGKEAGVYRLPQSPLKFNRFPDDTALIGPMFNAYISGVYAGGGGTDWQAVYAEPKSINDTTASYDAFYAKSWAAGPSLSIPIFGLFSIGGSASFGESVSTARKNSEYELERVDKAPVGQEWRVSIKNPRPRAMTVCDSGTHWPDCDNVAKNFTRYHPIMYTSGWAPATVFEFRALRQGCDIRQVNVASYQGAKLDDHRWVPSFGYPPSNPRGGGQVPNMEYTGRWGNADAFWLSPQVSAIHHTINLPKPPGCH